MGEGHISLGVRPPHKTTRMHPKSGAENARDGVHFAARAPHILWILGAYVPHLLQSGAESSSLKPKYYIGLWGVMRVFQGGGAPPSKCESPLHSNPSDIMLQNPSKGIMLQNLYKNLGFWRGICPSPRGGLAAPPDPPASEEGAAPPIQLPGESIGVP